MPLSDTPCLSLAIAQLSAAEPDHYAVWAWQAPFPGGYVHHDRMWPQSLLQLWRTWQLMFSPTAVSADAPMALADIPQLMPEEGVPAGAGVNYAGRLMQHLGVKLWEWLFDETIESSLAQSQGIAIGQSKPLRLRLEIRDPHLIAVPWEIMQPQPGKQAIALGQQILLSRTTSAVDPLPKLRTEHSLRVLLVQGQPSLEGAGSAAGALNLDGEASILAEALQSSAIPPRAGYFSPPVPCEVKTLVQPTATELTHHLERGNYNVFFYAGHGMPAPDGGQFFLGPNAVMNGTELAQVLTRCQVKLAVFNSCWGAQPDHQQGQPIPRSSLAEVLIHHGVPAVLGMRDPIADNEAISFIRVFARSLAERSPIDEAVSIARQQLLTLYGFNQPTWTLPVLYMHPEFDGELIKPLTEGVTEIPDNSPSWLGQSAPSAHLRSLTSPQQVWHIYGGIMRVGHMDGNDMVIKVPGVSRQHAEIFYRDSLTDGDAQSCFVLRDFSRFGTLVMGPKGWYRVHQREVALTDGAKIRFGNFQVEFQIDE